MLKPELSVIVTIVEGEPALSHCLGALARQQQAPALEVLIPFDAAVAEVSRVARDFPEFKWLSLGTLVRPELTSDPFVQHELYDRRRAAGLRAARAPLVAMVEDRGAPRADWARRMIELHGASNAAAIGGAVENQSSGSLLWAVFFCDFGRYVSPFSSTQPRYLTDINICYKRAALERVRELWCERYREVEVNGALLERGESLQLSARPVVEHRRSALPLRRLLRERVAWARTFAHVRGREARWRCLLWALATPALPLVLFARHANGQFRKGRFTQEFIWSAPAIFLLLIFWAWGELIGYCEAGLFGPRRSLCSPGVG